MTIVIPVHRALSTKLAPSGFNVVTRWGYNPWLARVNSTPNSDHDAKSSQSRLQSKSSYLTATRSYATQAATKPASRPKAHTGQTPAKRSTKASTSSKPGPKTAAGKKAVGRKPKGTAKAATTKTRKTRTTTKAAPKPKKPAVKKPPSPTALTLQRRAKEKELKEKALLDSPKKLPQTAWAVIFAEAQHGNHSFDQSGNVVKGAAQKLKNLTPEEKEHYNHIANQNKAANRNAEKKWLSSFTPEQIREANSARATLKRQYKEKHPKATSTHKFSPIKDDRLVKQPRTSYLQFTVDRYASGDFVHMSLNESSKLISREWKALGASERKQYDDQAQAESARYLEEYTTVYGKAPPGTLRDSTKATAT